MTSGNLAYSPGLDGLRAVAVLSVVAYHAGLPVPAGYVGVDIFFVISGYLITRLLCDEFQRTGRIGFVDFYARRARRILPILVVVIGLTLLAGIPLLSRENVAETSKAAIAAFLFAANMFFARSPSGYFDDGGSTNPLLHLWSLGVEEQFYLVWPLVVIMARKRPAMAMLAIAMASFAVAEFSLWRGHDQTAFYQVPARAWELAAGGLLSQVRLSLPRWAGWVALAIIAFALAVPSDHFPGTGALPAVLGSCLLITTIHSGHRCEPLEIRPLVWIGLISYSLYLWHWPVIVLGERFPMAWRIAAAFVLAALSYRFVETPFRTRWTLPPPRTVTAALLIVAAGAGIASTLETMRLGVPPYPASSAPSVNKMGCDDWYHSSVVVPCKFGPDDAPHKAVIIGDSVALQWFHATYKIFSRPGWQLIAITKAACPMVNVSYHYDRINRLYKECDEWRNKSIRLIGEMKPDLVIFGSANHYTFTEAEWVAGTRDVAVALAKHAQLVRLLRSTPIVSPSGTDSFDDVASWEKQAISGIGNVAYIDMNDIVCPHGFCVSTSSAGVVFRDKRHIHWDYAAMLAPHLQQELRIPSLK